MAGRHEVTRLSRPWQLTSGPEVFGPGDCLLSEVGGDWRGREASNALMTGVVRGETRTLLLHPYPVRPDGSAPPRQGFPARLRTGHEPMSETEERALEQQRRMNEVLARVQELEEALDDPMNVWSRLRAAWRRAEQEEDPRMAEIVRQASEMGTVLADLERRLRRVLRRTRERVPLDRVQEMDRASMLWLSRQPGRNNRERAGPEQRVKAIVRRENFDTLENRVLHSYAQLASEVAREWMGEHRQARDSKRYALVFAFSKRCRVLARELEDLGVGRAPAGVSPNYVLMQDRSYREVRLAWERLLKRERILDDLWAWQAETWSDFATLALVLAIEGMEDAELIAQSPIAWRTEALTGRLFEQDRPLAVFWLKSTGSVVEVLARPERPAVALTLARAHISLKLSPITGGDLPRRIAVWVPHTMERLDLDQAAQEAVKSLAQVDRAASSDLLRQGVVITPAHERPQACRAELGRTSVTAIAVDASGPALARGVEALADFVRGSLGDGHG